jgi:hypothetical protein
MPGPASLRRPSAVALCAERGSVGFPPYLVGVTSSSSVYDVSSSAGGLFRSPGTSAWPRGFRLRRSPTDWDARRRRSRRTFMTPPGRRPGRSRRATWGCAGAAAPTRSRATASGTSTATASAVGPGDRAEVDAAAGAWADAGLDGQLRESSVLLRLVSHANRWRGVALTRLKVRDWPPASVGSNLFGDWQRAREAARAAAR